MVWNASERENKLRIKKQIDLGEGSLMTYGKFFTWRKMVKARKK